MRWSGLAGSSSWLRSNPFANSRQLQTGPVRTRLIESSFRMLHCSTFLVLRHQLRMGKICPHLSADFNLLRLPATEANHLTFRQISEFAAARPIESLASQLPYAVWEKQAGLELKVRFGLTIQLMDRGTVSRGGKDNVKGDKQCQYPVSFRATIISPASRRISKTRFKRSNKNFNNWARTCKPAT